MKCTKEQLQAMSDVELLRAMYELLGFEVHEYEFHGVITIQKGSKVTTAELTPDDIMPLAFEHGIDLVLSFWIKPTATTDAEDSLKRGLGASGEIYYQDENPLRAIACCLIMVLQEQSK